MTEIETPGWPRAWCPQFVPVVGTGAIASFRVAGALLSDRNDEWLVQRRYLSVESMALILAAPRSEEDSLTQHPQQEAVALDAA